MATFDEKHDDFNVYLHRLEGIAMGQSWHRSERAMALSHCLASDSLNYDIGKRALLQRT